MTESKDQTVLEAFSKELVSKKGAPENIQVVSQDMSPAFRAGVEQNFPKATIVYYRFHLMQKVTEAVDIVRRMEARNNPLLKHSRMALLKNVENLSDKQKAKLEEIKMKDSELKTARAWRMKNQFQQIYHTATKQDFVRALKEWVSWVMHSGIVPMKEVAKTIKLHWSGIVSWMDFKVSNGILEGLNSMFQAAKAKARGYRRIETIKTVIYLISGKFDFRLVNPALPT